MFLLLFALDVLSLLAIAAVALYARTSRERLIRIGLDSGQHAARAAAAEKRVYALAQRLYREVGQRPPSRNGAVQK